MTLATKYGVQLPHVASSSWNVDAGAADAATAAVVAVAAFVHFDAAQLIFNAVG